MTKKKIIIFIILPILLTAIAAVSFIILGVFDKTYTAEEIYALNADAVFRIYNSKYEAGEPDEPVGGTGFFINSQGVAVTAYHVIKKFGFAVNDSILLNNGNTRPIQEILYTDESNDLAIIQIGDMQDVNHSYLKLNTKTKNKKGDKIFTIGAKTNYYEYLSAGEICETDVLFFDWDFNEVDKNYATTRVYGGVSGAPALNNKNQVIGIVYGLRDMDGCDPYDPDYIEDYDLHIIYTIITPITLLDSVIQEYQE